MAGKTTQTLTATWYVLSEIEKALAEQAKVGKPMEVHQAASSAHVLRRILQNEEIVAALAVYDSPARFTTEHFKFYIALAYAIRCEIADLDNKRNASYTAACMATARQWGRASSSVNTYASNTKIKAQVKAWMKRIGGNLEYANLSRKEILERELKEIEPTKPLKRAIKI